MKKIVVATLLLLVFVLTSLAAPLAFSGSITARLLETQGDVAVYDVTDATGHRVAWSYVIPSTGRTSVCPVAGAYSKSCYQFPDMRLALDWMLRNIR